MLVWASREIYVKHPDHSSVCTSVTLEATLAEGCNLQPCLKSRQSLKTKENLKVKYNHMIWSTCWFYLKEFPFANEIVYYSKVKISEEC